MYKIYDHNTEEYLTEEEFETKTKALEFLQTMFFYDYDESVDNKKLEDLTVEDWKNNANIEIYNIKHELTL